MPSVHRTVTTATPVGQVYAHLADFTFADPARLLGVVIRPALHRLANRTAATLTTALDRL